MFHPDSLDSEDFNWKLAASMAAASNLAYSEKDAVESTCTQDWGFDKCDFLDVNDTELFVASTDSAVVLSWRGTMGLADWIADLDIASNQRSYGSVHNGFFQGYDIALNELEKLLEDHGAKNKKLWVTGHSLGGALSAIFGAEQVDHFDISGFYTFGQPRLGDNNVLAFFGQKSLTDRYFRFVNSVDIITRIPPGYQHVGRLVFFDANGKTLFGKDVDGLEGIAFSELADLSIEQFEALKQQCRNQEDDGLEGVFGDIVKSLIPGADEHSMVNYISLIDSQIS